MYDVGTFVDRYRVERVIGNDAVAVVYGVRHTMLGSRHALKILARNSQAADKALQGARDQATLHHTHIVAITDILHVASRVGLVMELVEGGSLEAHLAGQRPSLDEALQIFRGVVRGMRHAHEHRILHGGLAMRRILLDRTDGRFTPKITGFGVEGAIVAGPEALDDVGRIAGLPPRLDTEADLSQLGGILYELLTARRPSAGSDPDPRALAPEIPEAIAKLTEALAHGGGTAVPSCQAILQRLDAFLDWTDRAGDRRPAPTLLAPSIAAFTAAAEERRVKALVSRESDDVDTDAPTDPGLALPALGMQGAVIAMAGDAPGPLPPMPLLDDGDDDAETDDAASPMYASAGLPAEHSLPPTEATARRRPTTWLIASVFVLAPALGLFAAYQMGRRPEPPVATPVVVGSVAPVAVAPPEPVAFPELVEATPVEAPVADAPPVAEVPVVETAPPLAMAAAEEPPAPREAVPEPVKASAPAPVAKPAVAAVVAPPKPQGTIQLVGDASQIWIEIAGAWVSPGGSVPAGTYKVKALFDGIDPVPAGSVTVKTGQETVVRCTAAGSVCR